MTQTPDTLYLGDVSYSSWSLRAWLMQERFGLPVKMRFVTFANPVGVAQQMPEAFPARTVPTVVRADGGVLFDSLALAEDWAERFPQAGLWPEATRARAAARSITAEMHAGFAALRTECPMNLRTAYADVQVSPETRTDLERIDTLWAWARTQAQDEGPWLLGNYSIADAFYAPVAARIAGYGLPVSSAAAEYVELHLADPAFRRWRAYGLLNGETLAQYRKTHKVVEWPGPVPLTTSVVDEGPAENAYCPFSGNEVAHYLRVNGRTLGFCNANCRDKVALDPLAWPEVAALLGQPG